MVGSRTTPVNRVNWGRNGVSWGSSHEPPPPDGAAAVRAEKAQAGDVVAAVEVLDGVVQPPLDVDVGGLARQRVVQARGPAGGLKPVQDGALVGSGVVKAFDQPTQEQ